MRLSRTVVLLPASISIISRMILGLQNGSNRRGQASILVGLGKETHEKH